MKQIISKYAPYTIWRREFWTKTKPFIVEYEISNITKWVAASDHIHKICGPSFGFMGVHKWSCRLGCTLDNKDIISLYDYSYLDGTRNEPTKIAVFDREDTFKVKFLVGLNFTRTCVTSMQNTKHPFVTKEFGLDKGWAFPSNFYVEPKPSETILVEKKRAFIKPY